MPELPYKAVLCDIDGVLRHWPPLDTLDQDHALPSGTFAGAAFAPERLIPAITGLVTDEEWRESVEAALAVACGSWSTARAVVAAWSVQLPTIDAEVAALLRQTRGTIPVALVSNATTRLELDLAKQGLEDVADVIVNTSRIGYAKPDSRVYVDAARRVGAALDQCLFIDDTVGNVAAARSLGMPALHFRTFADLRDALIGGTGCQGLSGSPAH
ncbi:HAD-IA family hydrolase [Actinospica robiniae]|uniref:HAD-IA family hydrolase n=1 Tax=Actinospica robiniae TaxID=304901 RepID=UPI000425063F|nr:HAD-IA family hydrolase [Actinospica robiniae]